MKIKRIVVIITVSLLLLIFGFIFLFINAFYGNPISAAIAKYKITNYVQEKYPDEDFDISKARYNFKFKEYNSTIQSKSIQDLSFTVSYHNGKCDDSYEYDVDKKYKTQERLAKELDKKVEELLEAKFNYKTTITIADFERYDTDTSTLTFDMPLDTKNPPLPIYLTVYMLSDEISYEILSARLLELHKLMEDNNIVINTYTLVIQEPQADGEKAAIGGDDVRVTDFPAEKLQSEDLIAAIKEQNELYESQHEKK